LPKKLSEEAIARRANHLRNLRRDKIYRIIERLIPDSNTVVKDEDLREIFGGWGHSRDGRMTPDFRAIGLIPWLGIEQLPGREYKLTIDKELKEICELRRSRLQLGGRSLYQFYSDLRREITRRREEANFRRSRAHNRWSPDNVNKLDLCELIAWIESELDKIETINAGQSANVQEGAVDSLSSKSKRENNGTKDQLRTGPADAGTGPKILTDAIPSGGADQKAV
jgi:hypothetical protein